MFLSRDELIDLTAYKTASRQIRWLRERRWPFELGADGRPRVLRAFVERTLGGVDSTPKEPRLRLTTAL